MLAETPRLHYTRGVATDDPLQGWPVDLAPLYGWLEWRRWQKWGPMQRLWEVPKRDMAVVLFAIGEIGVGKQIGRLAVLVDKKAPQPVYEAGMKKFWDLGDQTFRFSPDGSLAYVYEWGEAGSFFNSNPAALTLRLWGLDFERRRAGRAPELSGDFNVDTKDVDSLVWHDWP